MRPAASSRLRVSASHRQAAARNATALAQRYAWTVIARVPIGEMSAFGKWSPATVASMFRDRGAKVTGSRTFEHGAWCEFDLRFAPGAAPTLPDWAHEVSRCRVSV